MQHFPWARTKVAAAKRRLQALLDSVTPYLGDGGQGPAVHTRDPRELRRGGGRLPHLPLRGEGRYHPQVITSETVNMPRLLDF
jgi:hypothetical protein